MNNNFFEPEINESPFVTLEGGVAPGMSYGIGENSIIFPDRPVVCSTPNDDATVSVNTNGEIVK